MLESQSVDMYIKAVEQVWKWQCYHVESVSIEGVDDAESQSFDMYIKAVEQVWKWQCYHVESASIQGVDDANAASEAPIWAHVHEPVVQLTVSVHVQHQGTR